MHTNLFLISVILFFTGLAHAVAQPLPENMKVIGQAELKVLWFSVYNARLESDDGMFDATFNSSLSSASDSIKPLLLTLNYQRDISQQRLLDETQEQWQRAQVNADDQKRWLASLADLWPDIRNQDSLSFYQDADGHGHFYCNGVYLGAIKDKHFSRAFLNIWLADNSAFPRFTQQLTGRLTE
ncbi:chalcone isomerase family protein [uncultured Amphritea sp.]|uniref:chalcone isomerase family protein n=1 Tax=uncultured Amphritea sp. TaxID=981605 RepID=UPI0026094682|nr:chalcone isomerase family protein [uncultured Amphritea sp.]